MNKDWIKKEKEICGQLHGVVAATHIPMDAFDQENGGLYPRFKDPVYREYIINLKEKDYLDD
jgi:hypothetical protein